LEEESEVKMQKPVAVLRDRPPPHMRAETVLLPSLTPGLVSEKQGGLFLHGLFLQDSACLKTR